MFNFLKIWWQKRRAKHYVKSHWHLLADIILFLIIVGLAVNLIIINKSNSKKVDTSSVEHVVKLVVGEKSESLAVKVDIGKTNIYSGKSFNLHFYISNIGNKELKTINITPAFKNAGFSVSGVKNNNDQLDVKIINNKLFLEKLSPGETVEADIVLVINAKADSLRYIDWFLKTTYNENDKIYNNNYNLESLKLVTKLSVKANAYYHSDLGDQLGSGPIPPMVGLPTNYWVFFEIDNRGNDLSNLVVSAKLPEAVILSNGKTLSAGEFSYDEVQKRVTWIIKKANTGNGIYRAGFEVQLTPLAKQLGLKPLLLTNISYIAVDAYTGEKLSDKLPYIDTDIPLDIINQGQGKVIE